MSFPELDLILGVKSNDATFRGRNSGRHRFDGFIYAEECPRRKRTKKIFNNMFSVGERIASFSSAFMEWKQSTPLQSARVESVCGGGAFCD
jgi:hypothetical protein